MLNYPYLRLGNVQPLDPDLTGIAALGTAANKMLYTTAADTWAEADITAAGRAILDDAAASNQRTTLGLVIGTNVQAQSAILDDLNTLGTPASDGQFIVATGVGAFAYESTTTARTSLGIGTGDSPQFAAIKLGTANLKSGSLFELAEEAANAEFVLSCYHDTETTMALITLRKADNTEAAPALIDDNAILGTIQFQGYDGSGWHTGAKIEGRIDGTPSGGTDMPTELTFWTVNEDSAQLNQRMTIAPDGKVGIGTLSPSFQLDVQSAGSTATGIQVRAANASSSAYAICQLNTTDSAAGGMILGDPGGSTVSFANRLEIYNDSSGLGISITAVDASGDIRFFTAGRTNERVRIASDGNVGIANIDPQGILSIGNATEGGTAGLNYQTAHETHTLAGAKTSDTTTISIPAGATLLGVSFCVNTAVSDDDGDDTWSAAFITGSTATLGTGEAAAQNTKVNTLIVPESSSGVCQIQFTANGSNFDGGVIEMVAYYLDLTSLANV